MKVLLTGAFGNVGISALDELIKSGYSVRCFDLENKRNKKIAQKYKDKIEVFWGSLCDPDAIKEAVKGVEVVVHLAFIIPKLSITGKESEKEPEFARKVNVEGTRNLVKAMEALSVPPKLIFTSSLHVYGRTQDEKPPRTIFDSVNAVENYSQHKIECEKMIKDSKLNWCIFRLAATLPISISLNPGMFDVPIDNRIEFVHTKDVGLAIANAVVNEAVYGKTLLIGGGKDCQFYYGTMIAQILNEMGVGMLPEGLFSKVQFPVDWLDTTESQSLLHYQTRNLKDYINEMKKMLGIKIYFIKIFRPLVRASLIKKSPLYMEMYSRRLNNKTAPIRTDK
jgi:nucleoside-diphosphate-sugar epimerase